MSTPPQAVSSETLPKTLLAFAWHFLKREWKWLFFIQIFYFGWSLDHTLWPYIIMMLIDGITNYAVDRSEMWTVLAVPIWTGLFFWIGLEIFYRLSGFMMARFLPKFEASIRMAMIDYVQNHSYSYFSKNFAGTIANKISDMPQSLSSVVTMIMALFLPVLLALCIATVMFAKINPMFACILVGWIIVHMTICFLFAKRCDYYSKVHAESRSGLAGQIVDSLTNNSNVKLFSRQAFEKAYLMRFQKDEQDKHSQSLIYIEKMKAALGIACFLGAGIALNWYMLRSWQQGLLSTGEVVFIFNTSWNITVMAWIAALEIPSLFKEIGICRQALTIIESKHDVVDAPDAKALRVTRGEICFDDVTFQYMPKNAIFKNKTMTIEAGEKVGLVGFSGSGKSTFVHLILRNFNVVKGRILIDGQDIAKVTQQSLREQIALIPQDTSLFHRSLMENIRYGRLDATDEEVVEASKQAHCHEFIEKMSDKYNTLVGERGTQLSGGQRQRIAIARAILKNSPILILDEATSALDSVTEKDIQDGLEQLMKGRTAIVIAHRLSTLSGMDRILVFKSGKIIEEGSHYDLIKSKGHYAALWEMQAGGFLPEDTEEAEEIEEFDESEEAESDSSPNNRRSQPLSAKEFMFDGHDESGDSASVR